MSPKLLVWPLHRCLWMNFHELRRALDSASSHGLHQGPFKNTKLTLLESAHCDLALEIFSSKEKFPFQPVFCPSIFPLWHTEGPIETEMYLHCSAVCISLNAAPSRKLTSPGVSKSPGWKRRMVGEEKNRQKAATKQLITFSMCLLGLVPAAERLRRAICTGSDWWWVWGILMKCSDTVEPATRLLPQRTGEN